MVKPWVLAAPGPAYILTTGKWSEVSSLIEIANRQKGSILLN
jgi:hypothetical protein